MKVKSIVAIIVILVILFIFFLGCSGRMSLFSPRMGDTNVHKDAKEIQVCFDCHDVKNIYQHDEQDNCFKCHNICPECER